MSPKFLNFEIILIYFLLLIPWPHSNVIKLLCSRDNSRLVRKIVRSKWTPILDKYHVKLPLQCPLHPFRDLFAPRQDAKKRDRPTQWTCRRCGKSFYQEKFLDLHFETRHKEVVNEAEDAVCLADLCDIMRCDVFQSEESSRLKTADQHIITDIEVWGDSLGQNSALAKANAAYLSLIPLRTSAAGASARTKLQNRQLCQDPIGQNSLKDTVNNMHATDASNNHGSDGAEKSFPSLADASTKSPNMNPAQPTEASGEGQNSNPSDERDAEADNATASENRTLGDAANLQKVRANCKAEELGKLRAKCEYLVRSCIGGLLLSMSDQTFKEMEEEMNKAVCWYLSCDRYWEDGPLEPRPFPWGLIVILIFVLSTGICFCYYIIWILFDTEETTINAANQPVYMQPHHYQPYTHGQVGGAQHYYYQQPHQQHQQQQQQQQHQQQQQLHQQQQSVAGHDLYPEQPQYEYRHSPRRYIGDQRQLGTPTASGSGGAGQTATGTPSHHHHHPTSHAYQPDISDRRDYISNRAMAASAQGSNTASSSAATSNAAAIAGASAAAAAAAMDGGDTSRHTMVGGGGGGGKHYNTHPRPLGSQHRHAGASQQSLRTSASTHEMIQNDIGHNEHYIYVTYPPDLKKRFFEKYE